MKESGNRRVFRPRWIGDRLARASHSYATGLPRVHTGKVGGRANSNWLNRACGTSVAALTTVECIFGECMGASSAVEHNAAGQLQSNRLLVKQSPCVVNLLRFAVTAIRCEPTDLTIPRFAPPSAIPRPPPFRR